MLEDGPFGRVHAIHVSELKSFESCRRRWNWIWREHYYPTITPKPLEFGGAFHKGMEVLYQPDLWDKDREVATELAVMAFVQECKDQLKYFLEFNDQQYLTDADAEADYLERMELGKGMLRHYARNISPVKDLGFRPIRVEVPFQVILEHPNGTSVICPCHNLPVVISGRYDMFAQDRFGGYWIYDWKTTIAIRDDSWFEEYLEVDTQLDTYCWASWKLGLPVRGFVYVELRKGFPKPPTQNKVTRLGRAFSVNANQETDHETYLRTVQEQDPVAYSEGLYDTFLHYLQEEGIVFDRRHQIHKTVADFESHGEDLYNEVMDMLDTNIRLYRSPGRFSCGGCAFRTPCIGKNKKEDYLYTLDTMYERRENIYVRPPSTEGRGAT